MANAHRLVLDEGLPLLAAAVLRSLGVDAVHTEEKSLNAAADETILEVATADDRICVTLDQDFHRILAERKLSRPSVILLRFQKLRAPEVTELIVRVLESVGLQLNSGVAVTASKNGVRIRKLPLR